MPAPIDNRSRFTRKSAADKQREAAAEEKRLQELAKPTGRERPAWMSDKSLLPKRPPTAVRP